MTYYVDNNDSNTMYVIDIALDSEADSFYDYIEEDGTEEERQRVKQEDLYTYDMFERDDNNVWHRISPEDYDHDCANFFNVIENDLATFTTKHEGCPPWEESDAQLCNEEMGLLPIGDRPDYRCNHSGCQLNY